MARIDNPYIVGTPIPGSNHFFGRQPLLKFVRDTINLPQQRVVVFYGQRRIGKTSLLLELQRQLQQEYYPVYFDLMGQANRPLALALYDIAEQIADSVGLDLPDEFTDPRQFRTFLESVFVRLGNRPLLLLLDEFDDLSDEGFIPANAAALSLFDYLRDLLNVALPIGFIFVVGRRLTELPQNFQSILKQAPSRKVGYLNEADAHELITMPAADRLAFSPEAIQAVYDLTSGHPYFMQLICFELFRKYGRIPHHTITEQNVMHILDSAIETGQGGLSWFWDALPPAERFVMSAIAEAADAHGIATVDMITKVMNENRLSLLGFEITNAPVLLVEWEILQRVGNGYRFSVDLVRRWVQRAHPISKARLEVEEIIPRAKRYFENARDAQQSGQIDLAIEDYERAIAANPNHFRAHMGLAQSYEEKGSLEKALANYQRAYELDPENAKRSLAKINDKLATQNEQVGNLSQAVEQVKKATLVDETPTRLMRLSELQAAMDEEKSKREHWFRRFRYAIGLVIGLIVLSGVAFALLNLPGGGSTAANEEATRAADATLTASTMGIPEAAFGETQIIIAQFAALEDVQNLAPEAELELKLTEAFSVIFRRTSSGAVESQEEALELAKATNSAAIIYGSYSSNQISAQIVYQNGIVHTFDAAGVYQSTNGLDSELVDQFATTVVNEMHDLELIRLAESISIEDAGATNYLSGRVALWNQKSITMAEPFLSEAVNANAFEPITWQPSGGIDVIYVPAGSYERGREQSTLVSLCSQYLSAESCRGFAGSEPVQTVTTDQFLLDAYEVTNAQYADCVAAGNCSTPALFSSPMQEIYYGNPDFDHYPVIYVSWSQAAAYCGWRNGRLPTEAEWEKAARWSPNDGTLVYPWGSETPSERLVNFNQTDPMPVGSYQPSPLGAYDMSGNVAEWTADWFAQTYTAEAVNPTGPSSSSNGERVFRGGSYAAFGIPTNIDPAARDGHSTDGNAATGFRCSYDEVP